MKTINIAPYIDELFVFDDPEYCQEWMRSECLFLDDEKGECGLFFDGEGEKESVFEENLTCQDADYTQFKKCPQCKEAYQKAIESQVRK